jgi:hypothetical protein
VTYTACFCRQATVIGCSSLPPRYNIEFLSASGGRTPKYKVRAEETHAEGVMKTGGITDFIGATAGTFGCLGIFEIFGHNHLDCVIK